MTEQTIQKCDLSKRKNVLLYIVGIYSCRELNNTNKQGQMFESK